MPLSQERLVDLAELVVVDRLRQVDANDFRAKRVRQGPDGESHGKSSPEAGHAAQAGTLFICMSEIYQVKSDPGQTPIKRAGLRFANERDEHFAQQAFVPKVSV